MNSVMPEYASSNSVLLYEQALLGCILVEPDHLIEMCDTVRPVMFSDVLNRTIFSAMLSMQNATLPIDIITVAQYIESNGGLSCDKTLSYMGGLAMDIPSAKNAPHYAENLIARAKAKGHSEDLVKISLDLVAASKEMVAHSGFDVGSKLAGIEQQLDAIKDSGKKASTFRHVKEAAYISVEEIERKYANDGKITGLQTRLKDLDEKLYGLEGGDLIIIAARPSMGKTALAVNICENIAIDGAVVGVLSLEMPAPLLTVRMFSSVGRIKADDLRRGALTDEGFERLGFAMGKIGNMKLYIDDRSTAGLADVRAFVRKIIAKEGRIDLLAIDYLQLMDEPTKGRANHENRGAEITVISRGLKAIAKEFGIPVIALSQLNRSLEKRPDKRPIMSDLRESGAIEQDADVILFVYRDEVYNPDSAEKGIAEIIIGKQRNGPIGTVFVNFENEYSKFSDRKMGNYSN